MENTVKNDNNTVTWISDTIQRLLKPFEELKLISEVDLALKWDACVKDSDYYDILNHVQALVAPYYQANTTEVVHGYWDKPGFIDFIGEGAYIQFLRDMDNASIAIKSEDFRTSNNLYRKIFREVQTHGFAFRESIRESRKERMNHYDGGRYVSTPPAFELIFDPLADSKKSDRKRRQAQNRQKCADENRARSKSTGR